MPKKSSKQTIFGHFCEKPYLVHTAFLKNSNVKSKHVLNQIQFENWKSKSENKAYSNAWMKAYKKSRMYKNMYLQTDIGEREFIPFGYGALSQKGRRYDNSIFQLRFLSSINADR